jgi:hypothetical protein
MSSTHGRWGAGSLKQKSAEVNTRKELAKAAGVELVLRLEPLLRVKAKEKEHERKTTCQKSDKSSLPTYDTKKELAKAAGVSHDTIARPPAALRRAAAAPR